MSDNTRMCASFRWFLARKFSAWDVLIKKNSGIGIKELLGILGMPRIEMKQFSNGFSANTGQKLHPHSGLGS